MGAIKNWFGKWGAIIVAALIIIALLFALGCSIYTAIISPFVGIVGIVGTVVTIGIDAWVIYEEITYVIDDEDI